MINDQWLLHHPASHFFAQLSVHPILLSCCTNLPIPFHCTILSSCCTIHPILMVMQLVPAIPLCCTNSPISFCCTSHCCTICPLLAVHPILLQQPLFLFFSHHTTPSILHKIIDYIRVVHGSHSWAIFGSFSNSFLGHFWVFGRGTNKKELKMDYKMMWKMFTVNTLEKKLRKMVGKCIFLARHSAKTMKNDHFSVHFL